MQIAEEIHLRWDLVMVLKMVHYSSKTRAWKVNALEMDLTGNRSPFEVVIRIHHTRLRPEWSSLFQHSPNQSRVIPSHDNELIRLLCLPCSCSPLWGLVGICTSQPAFFASRVLIVASAHTLSGHLWPPSSAKAFSQSLLLWLRNSQLSSPLAGLLSHCHYCESTPLHYCYYQCFF